MARAREQVHKAKTIGRESTNYPLVKLEINQMRKSSVPTTMLIPASSGARDAPDVEVKPMTAPVPAAS